MSTYGKANHPPRLNGYDPNRSYAEASYNYISGTPYAPAINSQYQNGVSMTQMAYPAPLRSNYDDQTGPYLNIGSTPTPQVLSYEPLKGNLGTKVTVYVSSLYDLMSSSPPVFFLVFGSQKCPASIARTVQQGAVCEYMISAITPTFEATQWSSSQVMLSLLIESQDGDILIKASVGAFSYTYEQSHRSSNAQMDVSRKRKISNGSADFMRSPAKRPSNHQLRPKEEFSSYSYAQPEGSSYSPYVQQTSQYSFSDCGRPPSQYQQSRGMYQYSQGSPVSSPNIKSQSPQSPHSTWATYPTTSSQSLRSPGLSGRSSMPRPILSSLPSPLQANPPLIRTSTLQQTPSPSTTPAGLGQPFNPYGLYPPHHKAVLKIQGDLNSMSENWSQDEWAAQRRIVKFKRSQSGSTITATFSPVSIDQARQSICISCIWWARKGECYVTSVDTIFLLEALVAARFTVEEKNRIRRNLEGFRPLTVSKAKPDSEEFFKTVMAFPNPKPRNIEKDVKVFPWKILAQSLKKIIGKYSASPSSTLPPTLLTPASSVGYAAENSSINYAMSSDHSGMLSPCSVSRTISGTSLSSNYTAAAPSRVISPAINQDMSQHGAPPDLRNGMSGYPPPANDHSTPWQGSLHHMLSTQYQQPNSQHARPSWDMSPYIPNSRTATTGHFDRESAVPDYNGEQGPKRNSQVDQQISTS